MKKTSKNDKSLTQHQFYSELYLFISKLFITFLFIFLFLMIGFFSFRSHLSSSMEKIDLKLYEHYNFLTGSVLNDIKSETKSILQQSILEDKDAIYKLIHKLSQIDVKSEKNINLKKDIKVLRENIQFILNED